MRGHLHRGDTSSNDRLKRGVVSGSLIRANVDTPELVERFKAEHRQVDEHLVACEALVGQVVPLAERLKQLKPLLLAHLEAKDAFYGRLKQLCSDNGDLASANIATIFKDNMTVQSGAIRRFFSSLETAPSPLLAQSFTTMALIIRNRLSTEERAVFPLYLKNLQS